MIKTNKRSGRAIASAMVLAFLAAHQQAAGQSLTDQIMEKARRSHEYLDLIKSNDKAVQMAALQAALKDPDAAMHGLALEAYLRRFDTLTPEVVLPSGSKFTHAEIPSMLVQGVKWAVNAPTMGGVHHAGCGGAGVAGQVASGRLSLDYESLCIGRALLGDTDPGIGQAPDSKPVGARCEVIMTPNPQGDALEGPLHCDGVSTVLQIRLYFGA